MTLYLLSFVWFPYDYRYYLQQWIQKYRWGKKHKSTIVLFPNFKEARPQSHETFGSAPVNKFVVPKSQNEYFCKSFAKVKLIYEPSEQATMGLDKIPSDIKT